MVSILIILLVILSIFYFLAGIIILTGTFRLGKTEKVDQPPLVSVIVAARNEEKDISSCLGSLAAQDYRTDRLEVIIINDRSEDRTGEMIAAFKGQYPFMRQVEIKENPTDMPNKKYALVQGIRQSKGDILAFTDADCRVPAGWVSGLVKYFDDRTGMVAGYSYFPAPRGLRSRLTALQARAQEVVNAGIIGLGGAFSCAGRNLAYRRKVYDEVGGFKQISHSVSGDDDLFLQLVKRVTGWKIRYAADPATFVASGQPDRLSTYTSQQKRHVSAARYYPAGYKVLGAMVFLFFLLLLVSLGTAAGSLVPWSWLLAAAGVKFLTEVLLLLRANALFKSWSGWWLAPVLSIAYIGYVLFFSLFGLSGPVWWKG